MGLSSPTARLNPSPAPTAWVSSPTKSRALKGQIKPCHHYRQNLPDHALRRLLGGFPPLLPRRAKRAACTPVAPARNLNSFGSRFLPPPHAAGTAQLRLGGMHATEKPLRPTSLLRPHPRRPRPRKTPVNSQPAWHRYPAPAVRHNCRTPNPIESFSPVGPASSRKRAIRYRSSTGPSFAFGSVLPPTTTCTAHRTNAQTPGAVGSNAPCTSTKPISSPPPGSAAASPLPGEYTNGHSRPFFFERYE